MNSGQGYGGGYGQYSPQSGYGGMGGYGNSGNSAYAPPPQPQGRQYGGQMGMGLRNMPTAPSGGLQDYGGLQSGGGTPGYSGAAPDETQKTGGGYEMGLRNPGMGLLGTGASSPAGGAQPWQSKQPEQPEVDQTAGQNDGAMNFGNDYGSGAYDRYMAAQQPARNPAMGLQTPPSSMGLQTQGGAMPPQMGLRNTPNMQPPAQNSPFGTPGNPWLTRQQLDAQAGDVNYGVRNPGLDAPATAPPGGNQDAGAYPPGYQFETAPSTLDPQSMAFLTHLMGGSNSPWGPTQNQQVQGYNNWWAQQHPNNGPQNGGR